MKKILLLLLISLLFIFVYPPISIGQDIKLKINDDEISDFTVINNVSWVPLRPFLTALGCEIKWYPETETVVFGYDFPIALVPEVSSLLLNGTISSYTMGHPPTMINHQIHIPVRELAQILGCKLHWEPQRQTATFISKNVNGNVTIEELDDFYKKNRGFINSLCEQKPRLLSKYITYFNAANKNRTYNIGLACSHLNNTIVDPGAVFSFNGTTGPRGTVNGYKDSIIFKNGEKVIEAGGGVCQVSSTLYNAALAADLKILERHRHSLDVDYVPKGRDATVYYGHLDFKFKNNTPGQIQIKTQIINNQLTVSLYKIPQPTIDPIELLQGNASSGISKNFLFSLHFP